MTDKDKKKSNVKPTLVERIEKIHVPSSSGNNTDSSFNNPEEFVVPLVEQVMKTTLPDIDLSSREGAFQAAEMLGAKLAELEKHRDKVQKLKTLLQQKKFDLENS